MSGISTYDEMDKKIKGFLRGSDDPMCLYAAARIEELEGEISDIKEERMLYKKCWEKAERDHVNAKESIAVRCPEDCMNMEWDFGNAVTPPSGECRCIEALEAAGIDEVVGSEDTTAPICPAYLTQKTVEKYFWDIHAGEYERIGCAREAVEKALEEKGSEV